MEQIFTWIAIGCLIICVVMWTLSKYIKKKADNSFILGTYEAPVRLNLLEELTAWSPGWAAPVSFLLLTNVNDCNVWVNLTLSILIAFIIWAIDTITFVNHID